MVHGSTKASRLIQLEKLLLSRSDGIRRSEIARRLGIHRSTASRYVAEISTEVPIWEQDDGRIHLDREGYLNHIRLTLHEIFALHLASRLLADQTDRHNPHAASAVRKLGQAIGGLAPRIAEVIEHNADLLDSEETRRDPRFVAVLETLTGAWAENVAVDIRYRSASRNEARPYRVRTYHIRPYAAGRSLHLIGQCQGEQEPRTFRVDRIESAQRTAEHYAIPPDFDLQSLLRDAWSVWYSGDRTDVVLRFSPETAARVQESRWHRAESSRLLDDGRLEWRTTVAEPLEMYPWIRGWGADVEILEPAWLRDRFAAEVRRMAEMYGLE